MSLYDDLGVSADASQRDITAAFRKAAKRHHPDAGGDPGDFARINRAALILRDPGRRARYDRDGTVEDAPDRAHAFSIEILVGAFREALGGGDHAVTDIIAAVRKRIDTRRLGLTLQKSEGEDARKKIGKALKRLTHKGKGANVLAGLLQGDLDTVNRAIAQIEEETVACTAALAMADDYAWDHDSARAQAPRHGEWPPVLPGMGFVEIDIEDFVRPAQYKRKGHFDD